MEIKVHPYEFLARWSRDGQLQGYHVVAARILCGDDGKPLKKDPTDPASPNLLEEIGSPCSLEAAGLTLDDLLDTLNRTALLRVDAMAQALDAREDECAALRGQLATAEEAKAQTEETMAQALEAAAATEASLRDQIATLERQLQETAIEFAAFKVALQTP